MNVAALPSTSGRIRITPPRLFVLTLVLVSFSIGSVFAQTKDPHAVKPEQRSSASLPIPAGLIVNLNYPLLGIVLITDDDDSFDKKLLFDIFAYIDTWQLGYQGRPYGNVFSIMPRTVGRDAYGAWYFQYGSQSVTDPRAFGSDSGKEFSRTIYAFGSHYSTGYGNKVKAAFYMDATFGVALGDVAEGETEEIESYLIADLEAGVGARVPIGISGITISAYGNFGVIPPPDRISGDYMGIFALGLRASGAFNIDL